MKARYRVVVTVLVAVLALAACGKAEPTSEPAAAIGWDAAGPGGGLQGTNALALGTLRLEGTENAVTPEQAAKLLPLWRALAGSALKGDAERDAVARQIESLMSETQVAAIAGMRLTAEELRTWTQAQMGNAAPGSQGAGGRQRPGDAQGGSGGQGQGGAGVQMSDESRATRQAQFQNVSPEDLATRRAQFGEGGAGSGRPAQQFGAASGPMAAVIALLSERSGVAVTPSVARQRPSVTPEPTATPDRSPAETPTAMPAATRTMEPIHTATVTPTPEPTGAITQPEPSATPTVARAVVRPTQVPVQAAYDSPALEQRPDTDPGPPLTVVVSANRAYPDPLVEKSRHYLVSGIVRNDGSETYSLSTLHVTFFNADGFRGSYRRFPGPYNMGGEWIWEGRTEAEIPCLSLGPGQECPFIVEIAAQDMASFLVHPDATVTERSSVSLPVGALSLVRDGSQYVRIVGQVRNDQSSKVKNVVLSGVLLDAQGEIVSLGSAVLAVAEGVEPGESVDFEIRIHDSTYRVETPFVNYRVYAQAERDWG